MRRLRFYPMLRKIAGTQNMPGNGSFNSIAHLIRTDDMERTLRYCAGLSIYSGKPLAAHIQY